MTEPQILAFAGYQPPNIVTNGDLAAKVNTTDEWIRGRVGIASRRIASQDETVTDMAVAAGRKALAASGLEPACIDMLIVSTSTPETHAPNVAAPSAYRLGIAGPGCYDVNAGCAGFCYALGNARDAIRSGSAANVLIIGSEKLSQWTDWTDRSTCVIFGDGAGAAVVSATGGAGTAEGPGWIGPVTWGSTGEHADKIYIKDRHSFVCQEGQAVYRWAITALPPVAREACERAGIAVSGLKGFVPHQANLRIVEILARRLGIPESIVADDIIDAGNTSSASIPLALSRMIERGRLRAGDPVLLLGFGAGLSYAAQVITVP
jgi:3-oxoacyl-[acyl-carrier-protein] synthase-3